MGACAQVERTIDAGVPEFPTIIKVEDLNEAPQWPPKRRKHARDSNESLPGGSAQGPPPMDNRPEASGEASQWPPKRRKHAAHVTWGEARAHLK